LNFRAQNIPSRSNFSNRFTYKHHLFYRKTVPAHDIAIGAGSLNVAFDVRQGIIYSIKATIVRGCSAVATWLFDHFQNLNARQVACVNSLISMPQKGCSTPLRLIPALHAGGTQNALLWRQVAPSLVTSVATFFTFPMATLALIC